MTDADTLTSTDTETDITVPKKYKVVLLNDDFTPMDFVIAILTEIFHKGSQEAYDVMMHIHHQGRGIAGIYPKDVAYQKVKEVKHLARSEGHPLKAIVEKQ
jgi:ATP-dependent Clp protease adaptor protein ClpS